LFANLEFASLKVKIIERPLRLVFEHIISILFIRAYLYLRAYYLCTLFASWCKHPM